MAETREIAYLRELTYTNQCELAFTLKLAEENFEEDVRAVRQVTDTVGSLLEHIVNKLNKSLKKEDPPETEEASEEPEDGKANPTLVYNIADRPLKNNMVLKNLITTNPPDLEFRIFGRKFSVLINAPFIIRIELPSVLYSGFSVQPSRLQTVFCVPKECQYEWYKSKDAKTWSHVGKMYRYKISEEDIGYYIKVICVPTSGNLKGPPADAVSPGKVIKMGDLPACPFEERHKFTETKLNGNSFRLVSYNILSRRYADAESFPYCSKETLAIDYRKQLVVKELLGYNADIICLQEVDNAAYVSYYKDAFREAGYMSFFHRKGNRIPEGLACMFNASRLRKLDDHQIVYSLEIQKHKLFANLWALIKANAEVKECFLKQMTSLQITVLKLKTEKACFIVANTHLFYHPDAEHIRLIQMSMATTYINSLKQKYSGDPKSKTYVIFCGDMNSTHVSSVYSFATKGNIDKEHEVALKISNKLDLHHRFQFESACGLPKYTNYTKDFKGCLDYIFVEKNKVKVNNVVPFPTEEELGVWEGLPNEVYPSDHLALVADITLVNDDFLL